MSGMSATAKAKVILGSVKSCPLRRGEGGEFRDTLRWEGNALERKAPPFEGEDESD